MQIAITTADRYRKTGDRQRQEENNMLLDVIYSICFNIYPIGSAFAFVMTKMDFVQRLLLNEEGRK